MSASGPEDLEIPPPAFADRRQDGLGRREEDITLAAALRGFVKTGRVAAAMLAIGALVGGVGAALGQRIVGPKDDLKEATRRQYAVDSVQSTRIDSNYARIIVQARTQDSLLSVAQAMRIEQELQSQTLCIIAREVVPIARPKGCDAAGGRGGQK